MQFTADLTGVELRVATMADCSALGAALAGLLGLGIKKSLEELAAAARDDMVYQPSMPAEKARALHQGWQRAVQQTLPQPASA
jgi:glycerol kinase